MYSRRYIHVRTHRQTDSLEEKRDTIYAHACSNTCAHTQHKLLIHMNEYILEREREREIGDERGKRPTYCQHTRILTRKHAHSIQIILKKTQRGIPALFACVILFWDMLFLPITAARKSERKNQEEKDRLTKEGGEGEHLWQRK